MPQENIMSLDPASYRNMGICVAQVNKEEKEMTILESRTKVFNVNLETKDERFVDLEETLAKLIEKYNIKIIVFERTQFGKPFVLSQIYETIGVIKFLAQKNNIKLVEIAPMTAKKAITGSGKATKAQVIKAVLERFGINKKELSSEHEADAISLSYCYSLF